MLTGRPPFRAAQPAETLRQIVRDAPVPPRRLIPSVPRDLQRIALVCLAKNPADRYRDALELAEELQCVLDGQPIRRRPRRYAGRLLRGAGRLLVSFPAIFRAPAAVGAIASEASWPQFP